LKSKRLKPSGTAGRISSQVCSFGAGSVGAAAASFFAGAAYLTGAACCFGT